MADITTIGFRGDPSPSNGALMLDVPETVTITADVAAWLAGLVARQTIEIGHPDARTQAAIAWRALDQLTGAQHG